MFHPPINGTKTYLAAAIRHGCIENTTSHRLMVSHGEKHSHKIRPFRIAFIYFIYTAVCSTYLLGLINLATEKNLSVFNAVFFSTLWQIVPYIGTFQYWADKQLLQLNSKHRQLKQWAISHQMNVYSSNNNTDPYLSPSLLTSISSDSDWWCNQKTHLIPSIPALHQQAKN